MTSPKKGIHHDDFFAEGALCRRLLGLASNFEPRTRAERGHHLPRHPRLLSRFSDIQLSLQVKCYLMLSVYALYFLTDDDHISHQVAH